MSEDREQDRQHTSATRGSRGPLHIPREYKTEGFHTMWVGTNELDQYMRMGYRMVKASEVVKDELAELYERIEGDNIVRNGGFMDGQQIKMYLMKCPNQLRDDRLAHDRELVKRQREGIEKSESSPDGNVFVKDQSEIYSPRRKK